MVAKAIMAQKMINGIVNFRAVLSLPQTCWAAGPEKISLLTPEFSKARTACVAAVSSESLNIFKMLVQLNISFPGKNVEGRRASESLYRPEGR